MDMIENQHPRFRIPHAIERGHRPADIAPHVLHNVGQNLRAIRIGIVVHRRHQPEQTPVRGTVL